MVDSWQYTPLPNIPILQCKLGEDAQKFLWGLINETDGVQYLTDTDNYFFNNHLKEKCEKYIDYDLQFDKAFLEPLKIILDAIGWNVEKTVNLELFFS